MNQKEFLRLVEKKTRSVKHYSNYDTKTKRTKNTYVNTLKYRFEEDRLIIDQDIRLEGLKIKVLPSNLTINGSLDLSKSLLKRLPEDLIVIKDLKLTKTPIKILPDNLKLEGSLHIDCTNITSLPYKLSVGGDLNLDKLKLFAFPGDLEVKGSILGKYEVIQNTVRFIID